MTDPRIALGHRTIPIVQANHEVVLSILKDARVVLGETNKGTPATAVHAQVDRLWERVVDLP